MDNNYPEFAILVANIREFKKRNKLSYQQIGKALGVNKSHIYRVVHLKVLPSLKFLVHLSRYMNVSMAELFTANNDSELHNVVTIKSSTRSATK